MVSITTTNGDVLVRAGWSARLQRITEKDTFAATQIASKVAKEVMMLGARSVEVKLQGPGSGRDSVVMAQASGLQIVTLRDVTPLPHNGCRQSRRNRETRAEFERTKNVGSYRIRDDLYADEFGFQMRGDKEAGNGKDRNKKQKQQQKNSKLSEYGKQLKEKQRVRFLYVFLRNSSVRCLKKFHVKKVCVVSFLIALERRLDNVFYRLKLASTRKQCRQMIVHGHVMVNGTRVKSPSYALQVGDKGVFPRVHKKKRTL